MNKSIPSFVLGLIFSIIGAISSYIFGAVVLLLSIAVNPSTFITIVPFLNIATYVIALIGSIFSLFRPKVSGIIMLIASIISIILLIILCIGLKMLHFLFIVFWLPTLFILIAGIIAMKKRTTPQIIQEKQN